MGKSTVRDAVDILKSSPTVLQVMDEYVPTAKLGTVKWGWRGESYSQRTQLLPVNVIAFFGSYTSTVKEMEWYFPSEFLLSEVIQAYGEPSHVVPVLGDDLAIGAKSTPDLDSKTSTLWLIYLKQGFRLPVSILFADKSHPLDGSLKLNSLSIFAPDDPEALFTLTGGSKSVLLDWDGLQSFEYYCRRSTHLKGHC